MRKTFSFLKKIDIFGFAVSFRIKQERSYKTKFGGIITLIIVGIIVYQLSTLIVSVVNQATPSVIQQQNYVQNQQLFMINPQTFSFAFGIQDYYGNNFIDETIYTVLVQQETNIRQLNQTTGQYDNVMNFKNMSFSPCTADHFQIKDIQDYFLLQPFQQMYCLDLTEEVAIQGEFSDMIFQQLGIQIFECTAKVGCADPQTRQEKLKNAKFAVFSSDNLIKVTDRDKPYQAVGKNLFWQLLTTLEQEILYNVINNHIFTDTAYFGTNIIDQKVISYSSVNQGFQERTDSKMVSFYILYEKDKENVYYRKYMKLDQAFSQVGGTFNILVAIGMLFCVPFSQFELNRKVINSVFQIDKDDSSVSFNHTKETNDPQKRSKYNTNCDKKSDLDFVDEKQNVNNQSSSPFEQVSFATSPKAVVGEVGKNAKRKKKQQSKSKKPDLKSNSSLFGEKKNKIKFSLKAYLISFFCACKKRNNSDNKSKLIKYGTDIIYSHIDVFNIINKLLEIEKLKHLLLNEHQLMLFDYLPKPKLKFSEIFNEKDEIANSSDQIPKKLSFQTSFVNILSPKRYSLKQQEIDYSQEKYFLISKKKSQEKKRKDALKAYDIITFDQMKLSKIDNRLIEMVDIDFLQKHEKLQQFDTANLESKDHSKITPPMNFSRPQSQLFNEILSGNQLIINKSPYTPQTCIENKPLQLTELNDKQIQEYRSEFLSSVISKKRTLCQRFKKQNSIYTEEFEAESNNNNSDNPKAIIKYNSHKKTCNLSQINSIVLHSQE